MALRRVSTECFVRMAFIQRCEQHKWRNVLERLAEPMPADMSSGPAPNLGQHRRGAGQEVIAAHGAKLQAQHPGAAASLREGPAETLTLQGPCTTGALYRTLRTTNSIQTLNGSIGHHTRNVKCWEDADDAASGGQC
jgi:transposase-like protein